VNLTRIRLYERLMEAQEQIAQSRYARGASDDSVLAAMEAAEVGIADADRAEDLYLASLTAYVEALGGRLELHAVFPEEAIVVKREQV
jgi:hypothetical protein